MKLYTLGFLFDDNGRNVALIRKNKPEMQAGKLNGIGGLVEDGESPLDAQVREFREETGADIPAHLWRPFCVLRFRNTEIHCFVSHAWPTTLASPTSEPVDWYRVSLLKDFKRVRNMDWMIPMALDCDQLAAVVEDPS